MNLSIYCIGTSLCSSSSLWIHTCKWNS